MERRKPKKTKNDNPFSFRNFLTTASNNNESTFTHAHVTSQPENVSDIFNTRRRDPSDRVTNPYSFARFIQNPEPSRPVQCVRTDNCMIVQGELPDFVQDHFTSSNGLNTDHNQKNDLPDFTHHTTIDNNSTNPLPFYSHRSDFQMSSSSSSEHEPLNDPSNSELPRLAGSNSANLPDFLFDTGININSKDEPQLPLVNGSHSSATSPHHNVAINTEPNEEIVLAARISELEETISQKTIRIRQLEQQLTDQKRKEEEETEIMESMMRQVEDNHKRAVERWQQSERDVERLNGRVRQLETQLSSRASDRSGAPMHLVRHIGVQLASDLVAADDIMKKFMEHSDKMKTLAEHLQYLDRVEEIHQSDSEHTHPS